MAPETEHLIHVLASREEFRERYSRERDPIREDRLLWRAQCLRHMVHLLPGETLLEIGAGSRSFTKYLHRVSRGENPVTAVTFCASGATQSPALPPSIECVHLESLPGALQGRTFDVVAGIDIVDERNAAALLREIYSLLKPGGHLLLYESNPWNPVMQLRRLLSSHGADTRRLLKRSRISQLVSGAGFTGVLTIYNDFVYAPLTRRLIWMLRNLSILLENLPGVQMVAGAILVHAQRPGAQETAAEMLCEHKCLRHAVSVVVPCHNEEMNVRRLVSRILGLYGDYVHEIILVDDNSSDGTAGVIRALASECRQVKGIYRTPPNGVGRALADGYRAATGEYVLSMDCDFTHLLPEIRDLFDAAAEGFDVVIGSRFSRHSVLLNYPFQKIVANRGFHALAQIVLHKHFRDLTNNLKLMKREVVEALRLQEPHFAVNAETGLQPLLMGFSVREVPISWINRLPDMGVSSFRLASVGAGYWRVLLRLIVETRFGLRPLARFRRSGNGGAGQKDLAARVL
jgi:SAM-dependent methyltransferase